MFFIVFESTTPESKAAIAGEYYVQMQELLKTQPGFISETPFASPVHADQQVLIAKWTDEDGVHIWRKQHDHLQVQYKARQGIFGAYRLRVGPELSSFDEGNQQEDEQGKHITKHKGHFVVLYEGPETTSTASVTDIIDSTRGSASDAAVMLVDAAVYQGEKSMLWVSSWPTRAAAADFKKAIRRADGDTVHIFQVKRDYGDIDRSEAPVGADADQAASVAEESKSA
ncbi:MAG: hypothetical protein Q9209_002488 [Squamulea sp. 1 TL-2023]